MSYGIAANVQQGSLVNDLQYISYGVAANIGRGFITQCFCTALFPTLIGSRVYFIQAHAKHVPGHCSGSSCSNSVKTNPVAFLPMLLFSRSRLEECQASLPIVLILSRSGILYLLRRHLAAMPNARCAHAKAHLAVMSSKGYGLRSFCELGSALGVS